MGLSGISPGSLLLIFLIILMFTGGKKLRNIGEDLGAAFKSFKKGFSDINSTDADFTSLDNKKPHDKNDESK
tara:strand:+ start:18780 stop:18995 length:216 start_codon:yes stop_codon:yes gene_type:complete